MKLTVLISILVFFILWWLVRPKEYIKYYVIHLQGNKERHENIVSMEKILGQPIHRFDAVKGSSINDKMFQSIVSTSEKLYNKNEIGCYMSHVDLMNEASGEYSVIFEDDFKVYPDTHEKILNMLKNFPNFDILMIGDCNVNIGEEIQPNICKVHATDMICGASGYIIRSDNVKRFKSHLKNITAPIDLKFYNHIKSGDIDGYIHCPPITGLNSCKSTLGHH
jgi:GR25 family glycosyltransferase involved in LPS biosynthesis